MRCSRCGTTDKVKVYPMWPRKLFLCRTHAADHFKARRRAETAKMLSAYGDITHRIAQTEAHHIALSVETMTGLDPASAVAELVAEFLAAVQSRSVAYFAEFAERAHTVFPCARDRARARGHQVRATKRGAHQLPVDIPWLRRLYNDRCVYCGKASEHIDHLWPLKLSGDDAPWNLAPACGGCNLSKGGKALRTWLPGHLEPDVLSGRVMPAAVLWTSWSAP